MASTSMVMEYLARGAVTRLTRTGDHLQPVWTADGRGIVYGAMRDASIYWRPANWTREPEASPAHRRRGERLLLIETTGSNDDEIKLVLNWFEELERLVPSGRR